MSNVRTSNLVSTFAAKIKRAPASISITSATGVVELIVTIVPLIIATRDVEAGNSFVQMATSSQLPLIFVHVVGAPKLGIVPPGNVIGVPALVDGIGVAAGVAVSVGVGISVGVTFGVAVGVGVEFGVRVGLGDDVAVGLAVEVAVGVGVCVGVGVAVGDGEGVGVGVGGGGICVTEIAFTANWVDCPP